MNVTFISERDRRTWNAFISSQPEGSYLQSWEWGALQRSLGSMPYYAVCHEGGEWVAGALALVEVSSGNDVARIFIPRGPVVKKGLNEEVHEVRVKTITALTTAFRAHPHMKRMVYVRVTPLWEKHPANEKVLQEAGFSPVARGEFAANVSIINLAKSDDELLESMRPHARYSIRSARERGIHVTAYSSLARKRKLAEVFWRLCTHHAPRIVQSYTLYKKMIEGGYTAPPAGPHPQFEFFFAEHSHALAGAGVVVYFGTRATALAVFSVRDGDDHARYALHWEAMKEARRRGCIEYDLGHITPLGTTHYLTDSEEVFKRSLGGFDVSYVGTWDKPFHAPSYWWSRVETFLRTPRHVLSSPQKQ